MDEQNKNELKKEVKEKTVGYIIGAFGLVAGLAWNEAIGAVIENYVPLGKEGVLAKFIYAIAITLLLVLITRYLIKLSKD